MRLFIRLFAGTAFAALALVSAASAEPYTGHLDALRAAVLARRASIDAGEPPDRVAERDALTSALALIDRRSTSAFHDVMTLQRVALAIQRFYDDDATPIPGLLSGAVAAFAADLGPDRDAFAARVDRLVDLRLFVRFQPSLTRIDGLLAGPLDVGVPSAAADRVRQASAILHDGIRRLARATAPRRGQARPGAVRFGCLLTSDPGSSAPLLPRLARGSVALVGGQASDIILTGQGVGAVRSDGISISWSTGAFTGAGKYALDGTSGALVAVVFGGVAYRSESGSVTVTNYDAAAKRIEGAFDAGLTTDKDEKIQATRGTFAVRFATTGE